MAAKALGPSSSSTVNCTVCLDDVSDSCGRTVVKLRCSHLFHLVENAKFARTCQPIWKAWALDCIGSAFNVKGAMECPNCREIENGVWRHFENQSPEIIDEETYDEDAEEFEMPTQGIHGCPHGWVVGLPSLWYPCIMERPVVYVSPNVHYQLIYPPVHSEVPAFQVLHNNNNNHHNCDHHSVFMSENDHINGASPASVPSATLRIPLGDVNYVPNLGLVALPVILGHGIHAQAPVDSSAGLAYQGNNDQTHCSFPQMQPSSNSLSPVVDASMSSGMRSSNGSSGWLPAGHTAASSQEETRNVNPESLANLADQHLLQHVLAHDRIVERLNAQLNRIQERLNSEFHQFFPDNTHPSSDV